MKHLIIYAHPNNTSLNHLFKQNVEQNLLDNKHQVVVRDLYKLNFNPVLSLHDMAGQRKAQVAEDVEKEQSLILWADHITFIYPIWWTGMPAIVKGYIDRVFSYGFAYCYNNGVQCGLLKGTKITIINTHGKSKLEYESIGMDKALKLTSDTGIFNYCGLDICNHFYVDNADKASIEDVKNWTSKITTSYII